MHSIPRALMALREYADAQGVHWQVWDVMPTRKYTPPRGERRVRDTPGFLPERRRGGDSRRMLLIPGMEAGWLCFESAAEKRRLAPIPADWESCPVEVLAEYLRLAPVVAHRRAEAGRAEPAAEAGPGVEAPLP